MKRFVFGMLLLFVVSCERLEDLNLPYNYRWFVTNATTQDIVIWTNVNEVSVIDEKPFVADTYFSVPSGERYQIYGLSSKSPEYNFESFQDRLNFLIITTADKSIVIKECRVDASADLCDLCDESEWEYSERKEYITSDYYVTHHEWTFTITDADIGLEE